MYYVYILKSIKDNSYYYGSTENLKNRLSDHNSGKVTYTNGHRPYKLVWYCGFTEKSKALAFEKYLKSSSGHAFAKKRFI
jgi:predicted GIY-YIG superfamily endonuclease